MPAVAIDLGAVTQSRNLSPNTVGFRFTPTTTLVTDHLGAYDHNADGLSGAAQIGLWSEADPSTLLASVTVSGGTTAPLVDGFRYASLAAPVTLNAGETYRIGVLYASSADRYASNPTFTSNSAISYAGSVERGGSPIRYPSQNASTSLFGANFLFGPPTLTTPVSTVGVSGGVATNSGTFGDSGESFTLSANVGTVSVTATNGIAGTWVWSYNQAEDGPPASTVTITARGNGSGAVQTVSFALDVPDQPPSAAGVGGPTALGEGASATYSLADVVNPSGADLRYSFALSSEALATNFAEAGADNSCTLLFAEDGAHTVYARAFTQYGASEVYSTEVAVANLAPTPVIDLISDVRQEGTAITVEGSATDPGSLDTLTLAWAVFKDGSEDAFATGTGTGWSFTPDDNGSYQIVLTASDDGGAGASVSQTITVDNAAPTPTITGAPECSGQGVGFQLAGFVTDPGPADAAAGFDYQWSVAHDGRLVDLTGLDTAGATFWYIPTETGTYSVTLTVTDKDGGSASTSQSILVTPARGATVHDDLLTGGKVLVIGGTARSDHIVVNPGGRGQLKVRINHGPNQLFDGVTRVVVFGHGGHDNIQIAGGVKVDAWLYGGAGHDRLKGGGGNDVLLGGGGHDWLNGGKGRDLLLDGEGRNWVVNPRKNDAVFSDGPLLDANQAALSQFLLQLEGDDHDDSHSGAKRRGHHGRR